LVPGRCPAEALSQWQLSRTLCQQRRPRGRAFRKAGLALFAHRPPSEGGTWAREHVASVDIRRGRGGF